MRARRFQQAVLGMGMGLPLGLGLVLVLGACRHTPPIASGRYKIAVLPAESEAWPALASDLSSQMQSTSIAGTEPFHARVPLEVAQLSVECVEPTSKCFTAVGKAMQAHRLVFARVTPSHEAGKVVRVMITYFDVEFGRSIVEVEHAYHSEADARRRINKLVKQIFDAASVEVTLRVESP